MRQKRNDTLRRVLAAASLSILVLAGCSSKREIPPEVSQIIQSTVAPEAVPASIRDQKEHARAWKEMQAFYQKRQFQPAWVTEKGFRPQAQELLQAIDGAAGEGLDPKRYQRDRLASLIQEVEETKSWDDPEAQRRLAYTDLHLT
ncbi:MAG TPA: hypothetical protein VL025_22180, partial [Thermoanaerobaculia bacterium]|nr:hypothetical protein [Thermoanaerobaculia bacterium]